MSDSFEESLAPPSKRSPQGAPDLASFFDFGDVESIKKKARKSSEGWVYQQSFFNALSLYCTNAEYKQLLKTARNFVGARRQVFGAGEQITFEGHTFKFSRTKLSELVGACDEEDPDIVLPFLEPLEHTEVIPVGKLNLKTLEKLVDRKFSLDVHVDTYDGDEGLKYIFTQETAEEGKLKIIFVPLVNFSGSGKTHAVFNLHKTPHVNLAAFLLSSSTGSTSLKSELLTIFEKLGSGKYPSKWNQLVFRLAKTLKHFFETHQTDPVANNHFLKLEDKTEITGPIVPGPSIFCILIDEALSLEPIHFVTFRQAIVEAIEKILLKGSIVYVFLTDTSKSLPNFREGSHAHLKRHLAPKLKDSEENASIVKQTNTFIIYHPYAPFGLVSPKNVLKVLGEYKIGDDWATDPQPKYYGFAPYELLSGPPLWICEFIRQFESDKDNDKALLEVMRLAVSKVSRSFYCDETITFFFPVEAIDKEATLRVARAVSFALLGNAMADLRNDIADDVIRTGAAALHPPPGIKTRFFDFSHSREVVMWPVPGPIYRVAASAIVFSKRISAKDLYFGAKSLMVPRSGYCCFGSPAGYMYEVLSCLLTIMAAARVQQPVFKTGAKLQACFFRQLFNEMIKVAIECFGSKNVCSERPREITPLDEKLISLCGVASSDEACLFPEYPFINFIGYNTTGADFSVPVQSGEHIGFQVVVTCDASSTQHIHHANEDVYICFHNTPSEIVVIPSGFKYALFIFDEHVGTRRKVKMNDVHKDKTDKLEILHTHSCWKPTD
eukprot:gnl/Chilomastix_cuspidata/846.p1 GENE.gnl/Chilomastix_cuspidata/846~~gnl/Chilomastix_cuspidata/846.p1  ORF type:complete len:786 (+),score=61.23 gnl/Chilomastix_cuspidata/846:22-2358(+)